MNPNSSENMINHPAKLKWACRRGMLELDVLLGNFLEDVYFSLNVEDKSLFVQLLELSDPELIDALLGHSEPQDPGLAKITGMIRKHALSRI